MSCSTKAAGSVSTRGHNGGRNDSWKIHRCYFGVLFFFFYPGRSGEKKLSNSWKLVQYLFCKHELWCKRQTKLIWKRKTPQERSKSVLKSLKNTVRQWWYSEKKHPEGRLKYFPLSKPRRVAVFFYLQPRTQHEDRRYRSLTEHILNQILTELCWLSGTEALVNSERLNGGIDGVSWILKKKKKLKYRSCIWFKNTKKTGHQYKLPKKYTFKKRSEFFSWYKTTLTVKLKCL